jgi:hypothetical protein
MSCHHLETMRLSLDQRGFIVLWCADSYAAQSIFQGYALEVAFDEARWVKGYMSHRWTTREVIHHLRAGANL